MRKIIAVALMILGVTFYTNLFAQKPAVVTTNEPGWHRIGQTTASFKMQNESIAVLGADEFSAIKIKISEAPLKIERLQVFYESGEMEDIDVRNHFGNGGESRSIVLMHPGKDIKKVAFTYKTEANAKGEKADVELFGLKTNQPAGRDSYKDEEAEVREEARETGDEISEEARELERDLENDGIEIEDREKRDVVDAVEEGAKDAAAAITDRKIKNRVGPGNETAYIDDDGKIYIINNLGEKQFITKAELKLKPDND